MLDISLTPYIQGGVAGASVMASVWLLSMYAQETAQGPVPWVPFKVPYIGKKDEGGDN